MTIKELLEPLSYSESCIKYIQSTSKKFNCMIALYNFKYKGKVKNMGSVDFIGVFDYYE